MTKPLAEIRAYLDNLLKPALSSDPEGNGLLVGGPVQVRRLGAALNTSFWAIESAAAADVNLLLVHHAPWTEIDLHLRERKLSRLAEARIGLYAAHDTLDGAHVIGTGRQLADLVEIDVESEQDRGLIVGTTRSPDREAWLVGVAQVLKSPVRAWPNNSVFRRIAIVPGAGGYTRCLAAAVELGCDTFLTGEGSLYTELFAREVGLTLVYVSHVATEFPGICALAAHTASKFGLPWVALPEASGITGGGPAPLQYDWTESV
jgi:putative NIF3 family GTP cyclohydrolase 1 type 2